MHTVAEVGSNVAAFLGKLWRMVEDPETNDLISWSQAGSSFLIRNQSKFAKELLPRYYKHNNMASFIRQLNMYGFHKIVSPDSGGLKTVNNDEVEFSHSCFVRGHAYLLEHIKRKITKDQNLKESNFNKTDVVNKMMYDVKNMKGRQESFDTKLSTMKQENEALWRELSLLRQKHMKQQQIVNKLINFLVSLVQPSRNGLSVKKVNLPMIKGRRTHTSSICSDDSNHDGAKFHSTLEEHDSPPGPIIHELDPADFLENVDILRYSGNNDLVGSPLPEVEQMASPEQDDRDLLSPSSDSTPLLMDLVKNVIPEEETLVSVPPEQILPVNITNTNKKPIISRKRTKKTESGALTTSTVTSSQISTGKELNMKQQNNNNYSKKPEPTRKSLTGDLISSVTTTNGGLSPPSTSPLLNGDDPGLPVMDVNLIKVEHSPQQDNLLDDETSSQFNFSRMNCFAETPSPRDLEMACNLSPQSDPGLAPSSTDCVPMYKNPNIIGRSENRPS